MQRADDMRPYRENWSACTGGGMSPPYGLEYGGVVQWLARIAMQVRVLPPPRMGLILRWVKADAFRRCPRNPCR